MKKKDHGHQQHVAVGDWASYLEESLQCAGTTDTAIDFKKICQVEIAQFRLKDGLLMFCNIGDTRTFNDPLRNWWMVNAQFFPNIWRLAKSYLALPASQASSERAFSVAGTIVTAKQAQLDPQNVENLHFLRENWDKVF